MRLDKEVVDDKLISHAAVLSVKYLVVEILNLRLPVNCLIGAVYVNVDLEWIGHDVG